MPEERKLCPERLGFLDEGSRLLSGPPAEQPLALRCEVDTKRQAGTSFREHRLGQLSALGREASGAPGTQRISSNLINRGSHAPH